MTPTDKPARPKLHPLLKLALDVGPLVVFFAANARFGIFAATGVFMAAILAALATSYVLTRHIAIMPVVSAIIVLVFGSLTLALHDETFIKVKPTIIYLLFGATLLGGYIFNKPLLAIVFDAMFHLTEEGWRKLTLRWAIFFLVMAVVNEAVWRTQTTQFWIGFKLFGFTPLTFLFAVLQYRLLMKYASEQPNPEAEAEREEV
ncbi:MAG TPA: septation protein A [Xanthobacteraceae bacterium]|nr:septation protein A [Xanthobacteraceae bacterium]